jgi:chloramphenicol 3-O-phosphotransferase
VETLLVAIRDAPPRCGPVRVIAIDGGAGAGKTSLAAGLASAVGDAAVLHLDDLLDGWAGQFGYRDRLQAEVLSPLAAGRPGSYRRYDWTAGRFAERVSVPVPRYLLIEGVSALWGCAPFWSVGVFLDVPRAERERRWAERDGEPQPEWLTWLDAEDRFFAEHPVPAEALVISR